MTEINLSILIPLKNEIINVPALIKSIFELIEEESGLEVIISDNLSTDGTYETLLNVSHKRLRVVKNEKGGSLAHNFFNLISLAQGTYITFIGAGDYVDVKKLKKYYELIKSNPNLALLVCDTKLINSKGKVAYFSYEHSILPQSEPSSKLKMIFESSLGTLGGWIALNRFLDISNFDLKNIKFPMQIYGAQFIYSYEVIYVSDSFYTAHRDFDSSRQTDSIYLSSDWLKCESEIIKSNLRQSEVDFYTDYFNRVLKSNLIQFKIFGGNEQVLKIDYLLKENGLKVPFIPLLSLLIIPRTLLRLLLSQYRDRIKFRHYL